MKKHKTKNYYLRVWVMSVLFLMVLSACTSNKNQPDYVTVLTNAPTEDISPYFTQAALTVFAQITETALAEPTETPVPPTETPVPSATPTATATATLKPAAAYVWVPTALPSNTPSSATPTTAATASPFSCSISSQAISNGQTFKVNEEFDASWTIKNTGTSAWDMSDIDYRYVSGTSLHKFSGAYDLPSTVASGGSITLIVDMVAPASAAYYETFWGLSKASNTFCTLPVKINVEN
jgi:hypothetical protein